MTEATEHKIFTTEKQLWVIMLCWWAEKIVGDHGQWVGCSPAVTVDFTLSVSLVAQSCLTLCNSMGCSMPGLPVHHQLLEFTQTHVHWVGDAIQPSHPLSSPSPPAFSLSQHQDIFKWVNSSHKVAKVLELQPQYQSFQWIPRTDIL